MSPVVALRFVYLLALIVWLGGLITLGSVAAPALFGVLRDRLPSDGQALAGVAFGTMLGQFHVVAAACGAVMLVALIAMALLGPRPRPFGARLALIVLMLIATGVTGMPIARRIAALQREVPGPIAALAATAPVRVEFDRLHGLSTTLLAATVVGGVCLVFWKRGSATLRRPPRRE